MNEKQTLWLPEGYATGTIVYDKNNVPYEVGKRVTEGTGIFEITEVDQDYAKQRIAQGAPVLVSAK